MSKETELDGMLAYQAAIQNPRRDDPNWPLPSFDAQDWAEAFCQQNEGVPYSHALSWFACALMRGYDEAQMRAARENRA